MRDRGNAFQRYAIYWAPERNSPLADFGSRWLGWDAERGEVPLAPTGIGSLPRQREELTKDARRYGFHATLRNPFRLADGTTRAQLDDALEAFANAQPPVAAPPLVLDGGLGFVTLRPAIPSPSLDALAADCVRVFHPHVAPPTPSELSRRRQDGLDARAEANLLRWGYPWVMESFRFHLTLTCRLEKREAAEVIAALAPRMTGILNQPLSITSIALFGDPGDGAPFHLIRRFSLGGRADSGDRLP